MKKLIVMLVALVLTAAAQDKKYLQKVFDVKYVDVNALQELVRASVRDAKVNANKGLKALSVGTYNDFDMQAAEELVKRYDVPRGPEPSGNRNIELVAYMILAGKTGTAGDAVPHELDGVVKQLKGVFGYTDFRLLDSTVVRVREGQGSESSGYAGAIDPLLPNVPAVYQMRLKATGAGSVPPGQQGSVIRIDGFRFNLRIPYVTATLPPGSSPTPAPGTQFPYQINDVGFDTDLDIREGQKAVVGKSKVDREGNAFILVLTAKAVD